MRKKFKAFIIMLAIAMVLQTIACAVIQKMYVDSDTTIKYTSVK